MVKIEAVIRPEMLEAVQTALQDQGVPNFTVVDARGEGFERAQLRQYRGVGYLVRLHQRVEIEVVIPDDLRDPVVAAIAGAAQTGRAGDGRIFVIPVADVIRIGTGSRGDAAIF